MNKYEKLIELIVNEDNSKAKKLFHTIVVEQSRTIYESLIEDADIADVEEEIDADEEGLGESEGLDITVAEAKQLLDHIDGTLNEADAGELLQRVAEHFDVAVKGLIPVLEANGDALLEMAYGEDEDMSDEDTEVDFDMDGEIDDHEEEHAETEEEHEDIEDRVVDLEDAIDELKAEFDAIIGAEDEEEHEDIEGDMNMDDTADMAMDVSPEEDEEEETDESMVREYVEKVAASSNVDAADNKTSTVAKSNNMGGTSANIARGGNEKGAGKVSVKPAGDTYQNDVKAKAGKTAFKKKETAKAVTESKRK